MKTRFTGFLVGFGVVFNGLPEKLPQEEVTITRKMEKNQTCKNWSLFSSTCAVFRFNIPGPEKDTRGIRFPANARLVSPFLPMVPGRFHSTTFC